METIIGLLVVLVPVIFKLIGNSLEKAAGQQQETPSAEEWTEVLRRHIEAQYEQDAPAESLQPVSSAKAESSVTETKTKAMKIYRKVSPDLQNEDRKMEKIDPKKLVIYSEIMKPKYQEDCRQ